MEGNVEWIKPVLFIAALCSAVVLIVIGVRFDQVQTVLQKATTICLECIGIG